MYEAMQLQGAPSIRFSGVVNGLAQDVAEHIGREAKRRRYVPRVLAMDAFTVQSLPLETAILFVASTTGQVGQGCRA